MNLIDLIKNQLSGEVLAKLAAAVGMEPAQLEKALAAVIPGLLAAFSGVASTKGGAERLVSALRAPEIGTPGDAGGMFGGGRSPAEIEKKGGDLLGSILGNAGLMAVVGAVAKFAMAHPDVVKKLLSVVGPMLLSVIAGQLKGRGLNAQGLTSLMDENKAAIAGAMPPGLQLPDVSRLADAGAAAAGGVAKWLLPAAALLVLGGLGWWYFNQAGGAGDTPVAGDDAPAVKAPAKPSGPGPEPAEAKTPPLPDVSAAGLTTSLTDLYKSATESLTGVKDVPTAEAALPKLKGLGTTLDTIKAGWDKLPESARSTVARVTKDNLTKLKDLVARVLAIPGVSEKLKPVLDALVAGLGGLA